MASITIRNLSDDTKTKLRHQAEARGMSLEAHLRGLLDQAAEASPPAKGKAFPHDLMALVVPGEDIDGAIETLDQRQPVIEL